MANIFSEGLPRAVSVSQAVVIKFSPGRSPGFTATAENDHKLVQGEGLSQPFMPTIVHMVIFTLGVASDKVAF